MAAFVTGEGNWLPMAMTAALVAGAVLYFRPLPVSRRTRIMAAMNLYVGVMLAVMGVGHLMAVTAEFIMNRLEGSPLLLYAIGLAIVAPSLLIIRHTRALLRPGDDGGTTVTLHAWLAATLVMLGLVNTPLALPVVLNIAYRLHRRRWTGFAIVAMAIIVNAGLLIGGVIFMASGQTFEEFIRPR
jgi:hypothetical protein